MTALPNNFSTESHLCSAYTAASNSRCVSHGETAFPAAGWYIAVELIESAGTRSGSGEASQKLLEGMVLLQAPQLRIQSSFAFPLRKCSKKGKRSFRCSVQETPCNNDDVSRNLLSGFAASIMFLSLPNQVAALELSGPQNFFQLANALDSSALFKDQGSQMMLMMRGMTAKNFDPVRYSGRWFEVASLKRGFAGQGQEDCHCTQGVYSFDAETLSIQVDTFCVHGGPDGYITGIRGKVQCLSLENMEKAETDLEMTEMIKEKCFLRFPTLPFIPKEPYDVIATDYDNFALVSGAKDRSFVQIYSRRPDPGADFINKYKLYLADLGYDPNKIKDTPQDCQVMSSAQLALMMSRTGMKEALTNQFPDLGLTGLAINPFTSIFDTLRKLLQLYFK
ncbi:chloroplastic lipocalin [Dendrobium catenatum]|uniref:chloroplastic lipocalin n=1 Tax=Dendrobium catenatum TaxID=906689 RepID=UPI00109F55B9|nr:chloroplastic lipocalin [Dendrobium catenatum]